jgi:hypothetical protein
MQKTQIDGDRIFVVRQFLSDEECETFVTRSEAAGYGEATINTSLGVVMDKTVRDNARLIVDDPALATSLWQRLEPLVPPLIDQWRGQGLNERFRFYRYDPGQRFQPHYDGSFKRSAHERSELTFMVYLNEGFTGGETRFFGDDPAQLRFAVRPERGMALVFAHLQLHEGAAVVEGRKYVLRTDVMYRCE